MTTTENLPALRPVTDIIEAWSRNDAAAFAAVFTEDATMALPGSYAKGQHEIEAFMAAGYAGPYRGSRVTGTPVDVRQLSDDLAIIVTEGGVLLPGETEVAAERAVRATWVVVRQPGGGWRIAAYHNAPANS
ncbi:SgcJ/EcaC family oxidoreductase [Haloechinothrix sp. YIM 98757]|uniref:SgcJ/EcaC family oxidoreductase n=1 Tax=Haloechinothrix aidingensis TaxID=2752311 RepID=A0A837ZXG5_9PSEU|nr:SgcJ/EcaC family oxidoreductase [Haloechinothrix aidingensis]MBA0125326.1 SgcJ/EcaC family oxidoreductase [Haloechinothrix aidingensis]